MIGVAKGKKGKGKRDNVSHLMLPQQLKPQFWDWVDSDEAERAEADGTIVTQRLGLTRDEAVSLIERAASGDLQAVAGLGTPSTDTSPPEMTSSLRSTSAREHGWLRHWSMPQRLKTPGRQ